MQCRKMNVCLVLYSDFLQTEEWVENVFCASDAVDKA